jgi:FkbM family methyltransferase
VSIARSAARLLRLPTFLQTLPVPVLRGPVRGCWWTLYPYSSYWRTGGHEPCVDRALGVVGDLRGKTVWDCGAHFGIYSLRFSRQVQDTGQVAAFEPDPVSFARLEKHLRMNRCRNVVAIQGAASDLDTQSALVVSGQPGTTTSHLPYPGEKISGATRTIQRVRADSLVASGRIKDADLIKLDVEGHGGEMLRGAAQSIARTRPVIVAAMHGVHEAAGIRRALEPFDYIVESVGLSEITRLSWDDCQLGGPYLLRPRS